MVKMVSIDYLLERGRILRFELPKPFVVFASVQLNGKQLLKEVRTGLFFFFEIRVAVLPHAGYG